MNAAPVGVDLGNRWSQAAAPTQILTTHIPALQSNSCLGRNLRLTSVPDIALLNPMACGSGGRHGRQNVSADYPDS